MNKNEKMLIQLLNYAINNNNEFDINPKDLNWKYIIEESHAHNIYPLLYPVIKNLSLPEYISYEIKQKWKVTTLSTALYLNKQMIQLGKVFKKFNEQNIPVIGLKGIFLRDYYPYPDLRTMADADILVHKKDIINVQALLIDLGYTQKNETTPAHIVFTHKQYNPIEVHWSLADNRYIEEVTKFESQIWPSTVKRRLGEAEILCLCIEDFLIHLLIHMAVHMRSGGFGLRQICDIIVFFRSEGYKIDWVSFSMKIKEINIEKFTSSIFDACSIMFNLELSSKFKTIFPNKKYTKMLIKDIFNSGVFGRKSLDRVYGNNLLNAEIVFKSKNPSKMRNVINLICPPVNTMSNDYSYAKRYRILTPVAWIHHLFSGISSKEYSLYDKLNFLFFSTLTYKKRDELLRNLEL
jgi:hypothetical protein